MLSPFGEESQALLDALMKINENDVELQKVIDVGRKAIYDNALTTCDDFTNLVEQRKQVSQAFGLTAYIFLPKLEGSCIEMATGMRSESTNLILEEASVAKYEMLSNLVFSKGDIEEVRKQSDDLAASEFGKNMLLELMKDYEEEDEYAKIINYSLNSNTEPLEGEELERKALETLKKSDEELLSALIQLIDTDPWLRELKDED